MDTWLARRERVKATKQNGNGFGTPLAVALRLSLLPTPTASGSGESESPEAWEARAARQREKYGTGPNSCLGLATALKRLPTPTASCGNGAGAEGRDGGLNLQTAVSALPTPAARDWKSSHAGEATSSRNSRPLNEGASGGTGGLLNPAFVEWMMGYPQGWTVLCRGEYGRRSIRSSVAGLLTVAAVSRVSATLSFRRWSPSSAGISPASLKEETND